MNLFKKKNYIILDRRSEAPRPTPEEHEAPAVPDGMWVKCSHCKKLVYKKEMEPYYICPKCGGHFRLGAMERIAITCDENTFSELDGTMHAKNPMGYPNYEKIIAKAQQKSGIQDGVVTGTCQIGGQDTVLAVMDGNFMMGSMGSVVGEKITRAIEYATAHQMPIVIFTVSGGARMQEGIISLMQMAKTSAALNRHAEAGLFYLSVITDPTTGGVSASFASLGDVILAEPGALMGFAGQRVIEGTINEKLPPGFQRAEFQLEHGFVDAIVPRTQLKDTIARLLALHTQKGGGF